MLNAESRTLIIICVNLQAMFRVKVLNTLPYESARGGGEVLQAA
jgi:hypothetical protein